MMRAYISPRELSASGGKLLTRYFIHSHHILVSEVLKISFIRLFLDQEQTIKKAV